MGSLTYPQSKQVPGFWAAFGHSYLMTTVGTLYQTGRFDAIVRGALDIEHFSWQNHCVTGAQLTNQGRSQGGYARVLQEVTKSTRTSPYAANGGGCLMCWGINDIGISGNSAQMRTAWKYALRTVISRWRASSIKEDSDSSISWGSGWVSAGATQDFTSGTTMRNATTTTNATGTITLPADYKGETIALSFAGAAGVFGGKITFSGTSALATSLAASYPTGLSTSNIMATATHCPVTVRVAGTAADASKTIIMTVSSLDASGSVGFDAWWIEADNPPPVVICNIARLTTAGYAGYNTWSASQATADTDVANFNSDLASVVAEFDSMVQIADIDTPLNKGVPPASAPAGVTTLLASDGVHPNEFGAALCADAVMAAIQKLTPTAGLGNSAQLQVDAPQSGALRRGRQSQLIYLPELQTTGTSAAFGTSPMIAGNMWALPVVVTEGRERWIGLQCQMTTATSTTAWQIRWGIYDDVGWTGYPQCLLTELTSGGTFSLGTTTGIKASPSSGAGSLNLPLDPGLYWIAFKLDVAGASSGVMRTAVGPSQFVPAGIWTGTAAPTDVAWLASGLAAGALPTTFPTGAATSGAAPLVGFKTN